MAGRDCSIESAPFISNGEESFAIDHSQGAEFFSYFSVLRENSFVSDFIVTCCGQTFPVHRAILMASSDHFRKIWSKESQTPGQGNSNVDADPRLLELVLDYMYTGKLCVARDRMYDVELLARDLKIPKLVNECARARLCELVVTAGNCLEIWSVGEAVGDRTMTRQAKVVAQRSFEVIQDTSAFFALPYTCLMELVCSKDVVIQSDNERLLAALEWVRRDDARQVHLLSILKALPLSKMDKSCLRPCRHDPCISGNEAAKSIVQDAISAKSTFTAHHSLVKYIALAGGLVRKGRKLTPDSRGVYLLPASMDGSPSQLPDLPVREPALVGVAMCVSKSRAGSTLVLSGVGNSRDEVWGVELDNVKKLWTLRVTLSKSRSRHAMVFLDGHVYVVGGTYSMDHEFQPVVEVVDINTSSCSKAGVVHGNGLTRTYCLVVRQTDLLVLVAQHRTCQQPDRVQVYSTSLQRVTSFIDIPTQSTDYVSGMVVSDDTLIMFGADASYTCPLKAVYQSDPSWVGKLNRRRYRTPNVGCAVFPSEDEQSVFVMGGFHRNDQKHDSHPLYKVSLGDVVSNSRAGWQQISCSWPLKNTYLYSSGCCQINLPVD